ncbi:outer membrane protein [Holospora elegans]|uniref:outer membrane protein n=1 Tax=Holospora elegans TaxID=431043 RepID=UPI0013924805|nr:hypothetical protein [Holospora elegans]
MSGIGIIVGIGGATMSTTPEGSGSTRCSIQAETFGKNNQVVQGKFSIANELNNAFYINFYRSIDGKSLSVRSSSGGITKMNMKPQFLHPENSCAVNTVSCENSYFAVEGTTSTSAKIDFDVTSVKIEGIQDNLIDFGQKGEVSNRSGFSWNFGVLIQKVFDSYSMGGRCVFGANNDDSLLKYKTGTFSSDLEENEDFSGEFGISDQERALFRLKNKKFGEFIFEFGYIILRRLQLFVGPGIVLQKQELSYIDESGQSSANLSKTIMGGVLACGARYALNRHVALGLEYQHQYLGKKNWDNVASTVPQNICCCGTPITKTNANLFLVTLSCVFFGK